MAKHAPQKSITLWKVRLYFVAMLHSLHRLTDVQETSLHESSRCMENAGENHVARSPIMYYTLKSQVVISLHL